MRAVLSSRVCVFRAHSMNKRVRMIRARPQIRGVCVNMRTVLNRACAAIRAHSVN